MSGYKIAISKYILHEKLRQGDPNWRKFNSSFQNTELLPDSILNHIWQGQAITTHHKDGWRDGKNYLCGQHLGLDFDSEDERSTLAYLAKDKFVSKYASFIHTTISHTEEAPRARVVFLLDTPIYQAKNYTLAASALLWLFGTADRQCKDAVRFFYGAPGCEFEYINETLPLDIIKKLIANYQETGGGEKRKAERPDYLPPASQQDVAAALKLINPWQVDYDEWVQVLMAIHSQFGEAGFPLAENWAQGYEGEVSQKWKSFHREGNVAGAVTIATLFGIAKRFGWSSNNANI